MDRMQGLLKSGFVGREWIFNDISSWLENDKKRKVFCITGEPGIGKSALVAQFAAKNKVQVAGIHFCTSGSTLDSPRDVILSLAFQMGTRLPAYRRYLLKHDFDLANLSDVDLFSKLITEAGSFGIDGGQQPYILIVDGLDEAGENLARFIAQHYRELPRWLYFLVTSRPNEPHVKAHLEAMHPMELSASARQNEEDAKTYIEEWLKTRIPESGRRKKLANLLLKASAANFRYLSYLRDSVENGVISLEDFEANHDVLQGLGSLYQNSLERIYPDRESFAREGRPVLSLLAVAGSVPLPLALVFRVLKKEHQLSESHVRDILVQLGSLVQVTDDPDPKKRTVRIFHKSVTDWLLSDANTSFIVYKEDAADQLINFLLDKMKKVEAQWKDDGSGWDKVEEFRDNYGALLGNLLLDKLAPGIGLTPERLDNFDEDALDDLNVKKEDWEKLYNIIDKFIDDIDDDWFTYKDLYKNWTVIKYLLVTYYEGRESEAAIQEASSLFDVFTSDEYPDWAPAFAKKQYEDVNATFGVNSENSLEALDNLLNVYKYHPDTALREEGLSLAIKNIPVAQNLFSKNSEAVADLYSYIADFSDDYEEKEEALKQSKRIRTFIFHKWIKTLPKKQQDLYNSILSGHKDYKSLTDSEKDLIAEIEDVAGSVSFYFIALLDYAEYLIDEERYDEALKLIKQADKASIIVDLTGIRFEQDYTRVYLGLEEYDEALEWAKRGYEKAIKAWGKEHSDTLFALSDLSDTYMEKGKAEEDNKVLTKALTYKREVLQGYSSIFPDGRDTVNTRIELSKLLSYLGNDKEAYKEANAAYESCLKQRVVNYENIALAWLWMIEYKQKLHPGQVDLPAELAKFLEQEEDAWGENDWHTYNSLGLILFEWIYEKNEPKLQEYAKKLVAITHDFYGVKSREYLHDQLYLGWEEYLQGNLKSAYRTLEHLTKSYDKLDLVSYPQILALTIVSQALSHNEESLKTFKEFEKDYEEDYDGKQYLLQLAASAAARAAQALDKKREATRLFKKAIAIAEDREDEEDQQKLQAELAAHQGKSGHKRSK